MIPCKIELRKLLIRSEWLNKSAYLMHINIIYAGRFGRYLTAILGLSSKILKYTVRIIGLSYPNPWFDFYFG